MPAHRWTAPDLRLELIALIADGLTMAEIAARLGRTEMAVRSAVHRYGLCPPLGGLARHKDKPRPAKRISLAPVKWLEAS